MSLGRDVMVVAATFFVHASVYAAQPGLWAHLSSSSNLMDLAINLMSGICASMANTAFRLKSKSVNLTNLLKELAYGVGIGFVASVVVYALTEASHMNKFMQLAMVTLAGWGGAKAIEFYSEKHFSRKG